MSDIKKEIIAAIQSEDGSSALRLMRRAGIVKDGWEDFPGYEKGTVVTLEGVKYWTGRLVDITKEYFVLNEAAWIANTGRFNESFKQGYTPDIRAEVEPLPKHLVIHVRRDTVLVHYKWEGTYRND